MDESSDRNKAIQYWKHVYDAGVVIFNDPSSHQESLKSLVNTVLNTTLLCEIECLKADEANETCPFPFTAWLLEGIYGAAVLCLDDPSSENFYIESQVKLLEATYDRSVYEYVHLLKLYVSMLGTVCKVDYNKPFSCLIREPQRLVNAVISPALISLSNETQRVRFLEVILRVSFLPVFLVSQSDVSDRCVVRDVLLPVQDDHNGSLAKRPIYTIRWL